MKHTLTHLLELDISLVVLFEYDVMLIYYQWLWHYLFSMILSDWSKLKTFVMYHHFNIHVCFSCQSFWHWCAPARVSYLRFVCSGLSESPNGFCLSALCVLVQRWVCRQRKATGEEVSGTARACIGTGKWDQHAQVLSDESHSDVPMIIRYTSMYCWNVLDHKNKSQCDISN